MEFKELKQDNRYLVNKNGVVLGLDKKELKQAKDSNGYKFVTLNNNYKQYHLSIHRAVAETFIENPNNYPQVNHIDCNKENNNVENLEWCTQKQNSDHSVSKKVLMLDKKTDEVLMEFNSIRDVDVYFGKNIHSSISSVCLNKPKYKTAMGFKWKHKL